jgi:hypothetical protein
MMLKKLAGKASLIGLARFSFKYESDEQAKPKKAKCSKRKKQKK